MASDWFTGLAKLLLDTTPIHTGEVHAQDTSQSPAHGTYELMNTTLELSVPRSAEAWRQTTMPNIPWADEHFTERVSRVPFNPAPSHERWPFAQRSNSDHTDHEGQFSHTYPERFWPRRAGQYWAQYNLSAHGIRYTYGDLDDAVSLLVRNPYTRQAYVPIWFPEDLNAATAGKRVPCTLGYHFMMRQGRLHCWYAMRSCDYVRYLRDDVYMAGRLMQWVCSEVKKRTSGESGFIPGTLHMTISSLHAFVGDKWILNRIGNGDV